MKKGIVYLVGAGPGDPGLISIKAVECLKRASVVVYDYLANKRLLDYAPVSAKKIYVGKRGATHTCEQDQINELLIKEASRGKIVVRLKGGDPFVFGRGGEEAEALAQAGIAYEVIPGITSGIAVPAYAGIPVTHRDFTSSIAFVTGHEKDESSKMPVDWQALSKMGTVVFLMGFARLSKIAENLMQAGRLPTTPVAVIEWGSLPRQRKAIGTLVNIREEVTRLGIKPPTIIVVGDVVNLSTQLDWFEKKPLFGKRILVTRSRRQASLLTQLLEEQGAQVFEIPTIDIKAPSSWRALDLSIKKLFHTHWIVFTSVNSVEKFLQRVLLKGDIRDLKGPKIAAIGPATAQALRDRGIKVDLIASEFQSEGLVKALKKQKISGKRILIPRAKEARDVLIKELRLAGAQVTSVEVYRSVLPPGAKKELGDLLSRQSLDLVTFTSSKIAENFEKMLGPFRKQGFGIPVASLGPITSATAKSLGFTVVIQPKKSTMGGLCEAIIRYF